MALFEQFPYTNFHELNLDWLIREMKDGKVTVAEVKAEMARIAEETDGKIEEVNEKLAEFQEYIDSIDEEIQEKIDADLPEAIENAVNDPDFQATVVEQIKKKRIVFIGDSYGQGWTPDGTFTPWPDIIASAMGMDSADYYNSSNGGVGFGKPAAGDPTQYVPNLIQTAYENIPHPETVTDVVIAMGYNDYLYAQQLTNISQGILTSYIKSQTCFPDARIHIFAIGFTTNKSIQHDLSVVYEEYKKFNGDIQYYNLSEALSNTSLLASDGIHPVLAGQQSIAYSILRVMNGSLPVWPLEDIGPSGIHFELNQGSDPQDIDGLFIAYIKNNKMHLANTSFKLVTLASGHTFNIAGNTYVKLLKLKNIGDLTGFYLAKPYSWTPGVLYYSTTDDTSFKSVNVSFNLSQDMTQNDSNVYLWVNVNQTAGSGFLNINNIYRFGIMGFDMELPFITDR